MTPSISVTPSITPSTSPSALFEGLISSNSDPSDACPIPLSDTVWIEGDYVRVFTDSLGTIPFDGGSEFWHLQKNIDILSRSQEIDTDGYTVGFAALC